MVTRFRCTGTLFVMVGLLLVFGASTASAYPTGAPLLTHPVEPCRFLDTRVASGALPVMTGMDAFVRGAALQASTGAVPSDCKVPASAEAVRVNITVSSPTGGVGYLKINGTGAVYGPMGAYSRINYNGAGWIANEIEISLCNLSAYPYPQAACPYDGMGRYEDFQILNIGTGPVHVVGDVVSYLAR